MEYLNTIFFSPTGIPAILRPDREGKLLSSSIYFAFLVGVVNSLLLVTILGVGPHIGITFTGMIILFGGIFFILRLILKTAILNLLTAQTQSEQLQSPDLFILYSSSFSPFTLMPLIILLGVLFSSVALLLLFFIIIWGLSLVLRYFHFQHFQSYLRVKPGFAVLIPIVIEILYLSIFSLLLGGLLLMMAGMGLSYVMQYAQSLLSLYF